MAGYPASLLLEVYVLLLCRFGDPKWWPAETPFEVAVGAVLTQNTSWKNVEKAIENMKEKDLMDPRAIISCPDGSLSEAIRSTGYHRQKAAYLKNLSRWVADKQIDLTSLKGGDPGQVREELLSIKGVGEETADSILCYSLDMPVLVVDSYTRRLLYRLAPECWAELEENGRVTYGRLQGHLMDRTGGGNAFYNRFHALIVLLSKEYCRPFPACTMCPLAGVCATGSNVPPSEKGK